MLTCLRGPQGRLVLPIGSPSQNKEFTYLLTYLLMLLAYISISLSLREKPVGLACFVTKFIVEAFIVIPNMAFE